MPPAIIVVALPAMMLSCASITVFIPEPQTLLTVVHVVDFNKSAPSTACRAGAWPSAAGNTQPINASVMSSAFKPDCATAARMATEANCGDVNPTNCPFMEPMGVRLAATITTESDMLFFLLQLSPRRPEWGLHRKAGA